MQYIMAFDQGTTSSRCILFNHKGKICGMAQKNIRQSYPKAGWVEHNPMEILSSQLEVAKTVLHETGITAQQISAIGITNQRETTIVWDKNTGEPVYPAIVWQCRRTAEQVKQLEKDGWANVIRSKTGLIPDAYFFRHQSAMDFTKCSRRAGTGRKRKLAIRDGGYLAHLELNRKKTVCNGLFQCISNDDV